MRWIMLLALCWAAACSVETSGEQVRVGWALSRAQAEPADFATSRGYTVHLEEARLQVKAVYLYAPASATLKAVAWLEHQLVPVAYAHGGVDVEQGRRVLAEWTKPMSIDVLSESSTTLAETDAESGTVDAAKLLLAEGKLAHVRGYAERAGKRWHFEGDVDPKPGVQRLVELLGLDEALAEGSVVRLAAHPKTWLDLCEFAELGEGQGQDPADPELRAVTKDDQVGRAIDIGVRSPSAFGLEIAAAKDEP